MATQCTRKSRPGSPVFRSALSFLLFPVTFVTALASGFWAIETGFHQGLLLAEPAVVI